MGPLSNLSFLRGWGSKDDSLPLNFRPARDQEIEAAIRLILSPAAGYHAEEEQVREFARLARAHSADAGGLHIAEQAGRIISAVLPITSPGRTALIFLPAYIATDAQERGTRKLIEDLCGRAATEGIHLVQVLLDLHDQRLVTVLASCSFRQLAELLYLQVRVSRSYRQPALPSGHNWKTYSSATHKLFAQTILATYQNSLDCPALNGLREIDDIIAGHRATGEFDPDLWLLICHKDTPLGVLLLSPITRGDTVELVYLGLTPEARGRGIGDLLMRQALAVVASSGHDGLSLAVDAGNLPALKLYWRHGLQAVTRKVAMLRDLRTISVILGPAVEQSRPDLAGTFNTQQGHKQSEG